MKILGKVYIALFVFFVGAALLGIAKENIGSGSYYIHALILVISILTLVISIYAWRHPWIVPALLIATTLVLLVFLGFWQLDRADEKRSIEAAIKKANSGAVELIVSVDNLQDKEYYEVRLQGKYLNDKQFIYDNQIVDQASGYYVLTPFALNEQSKAILINRGFIPWNGRRDKLADMFIDRGEREIKIQISKPIKRMELKASEIGREFPVLLQALDLKQMGVIAELDFSDVIGLLDADYKDGFVRKWEPYTGSIEKHIGYAIQWFLMALVLAIIGIRLAIKQRKK